MKTLSNPKEIGPSYMSQRITHKCALKLDIQCPPFLLPLTPNFPKALMTMHKAVMMIDPKTSQPSLNALFCSSLDAKTVQITSGISYRKTNT